MEVRSEQAVFARNLIIAAKGIEVLRGVLGPFPEEPRSIRVAASGNTRGAELRGCQLQAAEPSNHVIPGRGLGIETKKFLESRVDRCWGKVCHAVNGPGRNVDHVSRTEVDDSSGKDGRR